MGDKIHTRISFLLQETNISWESVSQVCVFLFFSRTKSLSTIYCLEMHTCRFSFWYVPMHLCGVVLVCGSLVTENVWNYKINKDRELLQYMNIKIFVFYLPYIPKKNQQKNMSHAIATKTAKHFYWGRSIFHFYILFKDFVSQWASFWLKYFASNAKMFLEWRYLNAPRYVWCTVAIFTEIPKCILWELKFSMHWFGHVDGQSLR